MDCPYDYVKCLILNDKVLKSNADFCFAKIRAGKRHPEPERAFAERKND